MPTSCVGRKAESGAPIGEGCPESPESLARGMLTKGLPVNPGELLPLRKFGPQVRPNPKAPGLSGGEGCPREKRTTLVRAVSCCQGKPEAQARAGEQSYESIVPMKVENRRALGQRRPRYPLEGRDEQVDVSTKSHMHETLNSGRHVKWN